MPVIIPSQMIRLVLGVSVTFLFSICSVSDGRSASVDEQCSPGKIISATGATLTRAPSLKPGILFSDGGGFKEHGADEPCDPGKEIGPFPVDGGGKLHVTLSGSPPVKNVWSLYNSGVGVKIVFEPRIGNNFGPGVDVVTVGLAAEESKREAEGAWSGAGQIRAYIGAPRGSGPLTGSCFGQSYSLQAEVIEVYDQGPVQPGTLLKNGDRITTSASGSMLIAGSEIFIPPASDIFFGDAPPRVKEGTLDINTRELPDHFDDFRPPKEIQDLVSKANQFGDQGYLMPVNNNWPDYNESTLMEAYARIKDIQDPCRAALELKLFLDSKQDEFTAMSAFKLAGDTFLIWALPNNYDLVDGVIKKVLAPLPLIGSASLAENILSTYDRFMKDVQGTVVAQKARWSLEAYEQSRREKWTPDMIASEQKNRQQQSNQAIADIGQMRVIFERELKKKVEAHEAKLKELREASEKQLKKLAEEAQEEETRRSKWLDSHPEYGDPMIPEMPGVRIEGKLTKEEKRQKYIQDGWDQYMGRKSAEEIGTGMLIDKENIVHNLEVQGLANAYEKAVSDKLTTITRLQTEMNSLEKYAKPVAQNDCESLRKLAAKNKEKQLACPKKVFKIFGGGIRIVDNPRVPFKKTYSIETGNFLVQSVHTDYTVTKKDDHVEVQVAEGSVRVVSPDNKVMGVRAGQEATLPGGTLAPLDPATYKPALIHGLDLGEFRFDDNFAQPYGKYLFSLDKGKPAPDWLWQDPGADTRIEEVPDKFVRISVPDGNDMWSDRGTSPRLLHKVSGDFDLDLSLQQRCPGLHLAMTEFLIYSPGNLLGFHARQAGESAPGADYLILGGGWYRFENRNRLPLWDANLADSVEPPDAPVQFRLSRRGQWFFSQWSMDGKTWNLSGRQKVNAPDTLWAGLLFKRVAGDGQPDELAENLIRDLRLVSDAPGRLATPSWLGQQSFGEVKPLAYGYRFSHDPSRTGLLRLTASSPLTGDFDAVVRVDMGTVMAGEGQGFLAGLEAVGDPEKERAYIVIGNNYRHGQRYATDLRVNGSWGEYGWERTEDQQAWLRLTRKEGKITVSYWRFGKWVVLKEFSRSQNSELYLGLISQTNWEATQSTPFAPVIELEHLVIGDEVGRDYSPRGYSILPEMESPKLTLPQGVAATLRQAPFGVMNPFYDNNGNLFLLPAEQDQKVLFRLDRQGNVVRYLEGDVLAGQNWKRGAWRGNHLFVTVDGWSGGGNALAGLYEVMSDGTYKEIPIQHGHGGLSSLSVEDSGDFLLSDFEYDGVWKIAQGGQETELLKKNLPCAMDVAVNPSAGTMYVRNDSQGYTCGGEAGVYRIDDLGMPQIVYVASNNENLGGMVWLNEGILPEGLYITVPGQGKLLRIDESGSTTTVLDGLDRPGMMAATPGGDGLTILLGDKKILLLHDANFQSVDTRQGDAEQKALSSVLIGIWLGPNQEQYLFSQKGEKTFGWVRIKPSSGNVGSGSIDGDVLRVEWRGSGTSGKVAGRITRRDKQGRPVVISLDDGSVFQRIK